MYENSTKKNKRSVWDHALDVVEPALGQSRGERRCVYGHELRTRSSQYVTKHGLNVPPPTSPNFPHTPFSPKGHPFLPTRG